MRRQRHSSPSPAQGVTQAIEEEGRVKQPGQVGTNSAGGSNVWHLAENTCHLRLHCLLVTMATIQEVKVSKRKLEHLFLRCCIITRARISV